MKLEDEVFDLICNKKKYAISRHDPLIEALTSLIETKVLEGRIKQCDLFFTGVNEIESKYDEGTEKDFAFHIALGKVLQCIVMDKAQLKENHTGKGE